jgi:anaerobic magnesium-protoporphyrin IX monomethyl ester cyclase
LLIFPETRYKNGQLPLGVAYCGSSLEEAGHDVTIVDLAHVRAPFRALERMLRNGRFDIVGISVVTIHLNIAREISRLTRSLSPKSLIVWGGAHPTVVPEETASLEEVDIVIKGEGERALTALTGDPSCRDIPGMAFVQGGEVIDTGPPHYVENLDDLPFPARHLLSMDDYMRFWYSLDAVSPRIRGTGIMGSRGCPYRCSFCQPTLSLLFGKRVRKRSPLNIASELEELKRRYAIEGFMFEDSTFVLDKSWVTSVCDAIGDLGLRWCCNIRADLVDEDMLETMAKAGLAKVNIGIESAVQRILDMAYQKNITRQQVDDVVAWCRRIGLKVQGYFILGTPIETKEEMLETINYAVNLDIDDAVFDIATPFPETHMYSMWKDYVTTEFADFDCFHRSVFDNMHGVSKRWIERQKKLAYYKFYMHPKRLRYVARMISTPVGLGRTLMKARRV